MFDLVLFPFLTYKFALWTIKNTRMCDECVKYSKRILGEKRKKILIIRSTENKHKIYKKGRKGENVENVIHPGTIC